MATGATKRGILWKAIAAFGGVGLGGSFCLLQNIHSKEQEKLNSDPNPSDDNVPSYRSSRWDWDFNWDKRDPGFRLLARHFRPGAKKVKPISEEDLEELSGLIPKAKRNIFLIRHGQYDQKPLSDSERRLTDLGRKQAALTGQRLKEVIPNFDRYVVSDMSRALETAEIIGGSLCPESPNKLNSFKVDPLLREGAPIQPDPGNHWHPMLRYFNDEMRIEAAFRKYFHRADPDQEQDSFEVIVCHANVIRYFCCRALQFPPERWLRISLANGSITQIQINPDGDVTLFKVGDTGHMPKELVTTK